MIAGLIMGGLGMAAVFLGLLILGAGRRHEEVTALLDQEYRKGYERGWDERSGLAGNGCGRGVEGTMEGGAGR